MYAALHACSNVAQAVCVATRTITALAVGISGRGTPLLQFQFLPAGALDPGVLLELRRFLRVVGPFDAYRAQQLHLVQHLTGLKATSHAHLSDCCLFTAHAGGHTSHRSHC